MGSVYLVQHLKTDEELALKVLHSTIVTDQVALERFQREARTPARIGSDHVVRVVDADVAPELGGVPFMVMELLQGCDLDQLLERRGTLPPVEVVSFLRQAARALDKAHAMGIVHRDLKPENLFLTTREDGSLFIKVLDFGIAKISGAAGDLARHGSVTTTGQIFGTPLYMSPEQAKAESAKISPQTDVWALGLIAHKLLTGRDVWTAETLTHLIAQIAYEPMPVPSTRGAAFGPAYDAWFARCCAREAQARYGSAGEAVAALASSLGVNDVLGPPSSDLQSMFTAPGSTAHLGPSNPAHERPSFAATVEDAATRAQLRTSAGSLTRTATGAPAMRRGLVVTIAVVGALAGVGVGLAVVKGRGSVSAVGPVLSAEVSANVRGAPTASAAVAEGGAPEVVPAPEPSSVPSAEAPAPGGPSAPRSSPPSVPTGEPPGAHASARAVGKTTSRPTAPVAVPRPPPVPPPAPAATDDPLAGRH